MLALSPSSDRATQLGIGALGVVSGGTTALFTDRLIPPIAVMAVFFVVSAIHQYRQQ
ncbi:MAG: SipW-dependent-type signal peptide-containing protein [Halonotius sp.]